MVNISITLLLFVLILIIL